MSRLLNLEMGSGQRESQGPYNELAPDALDLMWQTPLPSGFPTQLPSYQLPIVKSLQPRGALWPARSPWSPLMSMLSAP